MDKRDKAHDGVVHLGFAILCAPFRTSLLAGRVFPRSFIETANIYDTCGLTELNLS